MKTLLNRLLSRAKASAIGPQVHPTASESRTAAPHPPPPGTPNVTYSSPVVPERIGESPDNYMAFFREHPEGLEWYQWMYDSRRDQHECFEHWFRFAGAVEPISSVLELGCGYAVGYADFFSGIRYVGADISETAVAWCKANRRHPEHDYVACDFITHRFDERFDVVFSQGTIDNTYDMDAFLHSCLKASRRWIYVTAYRGFFADLPEHRYQVVREQGTFYNDLSAVRAWRTLKEFGARDITVVPSFTGGRTDSPGIPFETLIIARVPND